MLDHIITFSIRNKLIVLMMAAGIIAAGSYALYNIPIGAVPDVTNNQVQVITTSRELSTQEVERFLTYPVELEMANLPGVQEIRSISKFGLSVVTIVFDDEMGTYLPRQLIGERLKSISDLIPEGFGTPFMGPISTGLGEIYQYILDVQPAYADQYDVTELRSIQDWIVKRQLSGIPGVVEVNTWGGFLKTYEVAIDPNTLRAMDISLSEVYDALTDNNGVTGGGYIEKSQEAYFIRAESLIRSVSDIESIVVDNSRGTPIYIRDIAKVGYGAATRFGAITGNGEGEKVLGQVMMLKGGNSKKVIDAVKARVAEVQKTLPTGVFINPILDRSELIGRTTNTIAENLILGFLIVLFVVVLLLGNLRSGLVVASVIPLTLLFALWMMYLFGVDANLMSLGAIDFGIIIDGAVVIVEYIAYQLSIKSPELMGLTSIDRSTRINEIARSGASKMMRSAIFGQIIIIIVFIPVLSLAGIEGKMFRPMALAFCFALLGAMILCVTYVPVMAALFLKPSSISSSNFSSRLLSRLQLWYGNVLSYALNVRILILAAAVLTFLGVTVLFTQMGGEFVPTLDEGDFVIQPVLKTGMSLGATVDMTTRMEKIIGGFPEVRQVVSRIGAAEVPTDPMSMEESDVIITLNDKRTWTTATSKDGLADAFKTALLKEIPGVEIEFTQPIEMRFNELISGTRADLAIKLYGEDLGILYKKAQEIEDVIRDIEGAADISVEKIDDLPQMSVKYHRDRLARYGVSIKQLNDIISIGIGGRIAGLVLEGERQYDIVLRYGENARDDINDLRRAIVDLPDGRHLPLSEFADIKLTTGPAKVSRDDTKRRVIVGVNIRGRDLQSVVDEVQMVIDEKVSLPVGYYLDFGGQFENLEMAKKRLSVAVPIALILIFILLYFAFGNATEALLIYSAIPLAAIGGVLALYARGMPFSISAGVGFIALFGIAVLNGIVMIEHFKELNQNGMRDIKDQIIAGAKDRLRPVLLTATAAALGFLPMAISTSAGAEVQRPLATVVIGGLISACLLTLIVLPILYSLYLSRVRVRSSQLGAMSMVVGLVIIPSLMHSQNSLSLEDILQRGISSNLNLEAANIKISKEEALLGATKEVAKTDFFYQHDRNNLPEVGGPLHVIGAGQSWLSPGVHKARRELQNAEIVVAQQQREWLELTYEAAVRLLHDRLLYHHQRVSLYESVDSLYQVLYAKSDRLLELGESTMVDKLTIKQQLEEVRLEIDQIHWELSNTHQFLMAVIGSEDSLVVATSTYEQISVEADPAGALTNLQDAMIIRSKRRAEAVDSDRLPQWSATAFAGTNSFNSFKLIPGVEIGVAVPLSSKQYEAQQKAQILETEIMEVEKENALRSLRLERQRLKQKIESIQRRIDEYQTQMLPAITELMSTAEQSLEAGQIDYFQYLLIIQKSYQSEITFLDLIYQYNQATISYNYPLNQ